MHSNEESTNGTHTDSELGHGDHQSYYYHNNIHMRLDDESKAPLNSKWKAATASSQQDQEDAKPKLAAQKEMTLPKDPEVNNSHLLPHYEIYMNNIAQKTVIVQRRTPFRFQTYINASHTVRVSRVFMWCFHHSTTATAWRASSTGRTTPWRKDARRSPTVRVTVTPSPSGRGPGTSAVTSRAATLSRVRHLELCITVDAMIHVHVYPYQNRSILTSIFKPSQVIGRQFVA